MKREEKKVKNEGPNVTSFADLQEYSRGVLLELPEFAEGQPFVARLARPSMLVLVRQKKIPNQLLASANALFVKGGQSANLEDEEMLSNMFGVMDVICDASLLEPTYEEIKEAGLVLTDEQMMFIFNYSQRGAKALEPFRQK